MTERQKAVAADRPGESQCRRRQFERRRHRLQPGDQSGSYLHQSEAARSAQGERPRDHPAAARRPPPRSRASRSIFQPIQNIQVGGRLSKSLYQYTLQDGDLDELYHFAPLMNKKLSELPGFQDVTSDLQIGNLKAVLDIDTDKASQFGITADAIRNTLYSAFGERQVSTIYTPSNDYEVILEADPRVPGGSGGAVAHLCQADHRTDDGADPARRLRDGASLGRPAHRQSPGTAALGDDLLQPRARRLARRRGAAHPAARARHEPAGHRLDRLPGHGAGVPGFAARPGLAADCRGAGHLHGARHPLRELHPPDHHPVGPALGRSRRAADPAAVPSGSQRHRHHRHRHADRHREEERDHDGRLRDRAPQDAGHHRRGGDLRGLPAALPPDHDDDDGGDHGHPADRARPRRRLRAAPSARPRRRRRSLRLAGADAVTSRRSSISIWRRRARSSARRTSRQRRRSGAKGFPPPPANNPGTSDHHGTGSDETVWKGEPPSGAAPDDGHRRRLGARAAHGRARSICRRSRRTTTRAASTKRGAIRRPPGTARSPGATPAAAIPPSIAPRSPSSG